MGLLKTAATVAVASSVHGRVQRRQQARWAAQEPAPTGVPPSAPAQYATTTAAASLRRADAGGTQVPDAQAHAVGTSDRLAQLKQLGELLSAGVLTQAEFDQEKAASSTADLIADTGKEQCGLCRRAPVMRRPRADRERASSP